MAKRLKVDCGGKENNASTPIENIISTLSKAAEANQPKRKRDESTLDKAEGINGEDKKMAPPSTRKLLKTKRPTSSNKSNSEEFSVMPRSSVVVDNFSSWSTPEERESLIGITCDAVLPKKHRRGFVPKAVADSFGLIPKVQTQFEQKILFFGPKKDRTVPRDEDESLPSPKRARTEAWKGWGNAFGLQLEKVKCDTCLIPNDPSNQVCIVCGESLPSAKSSAGATQKWTTSYAPTKKRKIDSLTTNDD
jgi:hypothetical protein